MTEQPSHPTIKGIVEQHHSLTPKARILSNYILKNPRKAVFMTTKELAETCGVSEATVVPQEPPPSNPTLRFCIVTSPV